MPTSKIMIIRPAEKPSGKTHGVTAAGEQNAEELIVRGWQRSGALVRFFKPRGGKFTEPRLAEPKTIFASAAGPQSKSLRPQHTVLALSAKLKLQPDLSFTKGDESELVKAALGADGPVLIAWEHEVIPKIVNAIVGDDTTCPQKWPDKRFDLVWVLDRRKSAKGWRFTQVPQLLLAGDSKEPIA